MTNKSKTIKKEPKNVPSKNGGPAASSIYASLAFAIVVVAIGIPMWWKTTDVYRVPLPYDQVAALTSKKINHVIPVTVVLADKTVDHTKLWEGIYTISPVEPTGSNYIDVTYHWAIRELLIEEDEAFASSNSSEDLETKIAKLYKTQEMPVGSIHIFILAKGNKITNQEIVIGTLRIAIVTNEGNIDKLVFSLVNTAKNYVVKENILRKVFLAPSQRPRDQPEKEVMRPIGALPVLDILFTLIVSQPHICDASWDIEAAEKEYLEPFVKKLLPLTKVNIKSQVLHMISMNVKTKFNNSTKENYLQLDQLPQIINPFEAKLGTQFSVNPTLNFVIYIPTMSQVPLRIYDNDGMKVQSNAFLSPRWGGFLIQNPNEYGINEKVVMQIDMQNVMSIFISQLRLLIGLPELSEKDESNVQYLQSSLGTDIEMDFFLRRRTQEQLSVTISSLMSLTHLLATINNIVITDEIGEKVNMAVQCVEDSLKDLENGLLFEAYSKAKQAFVSSEEAFFDPSLLAMLYFPNDQKYAVYIPLFLPVSLPVLMSFRQFWAYFRQSRKVIKID